MRFRRSLGLLMAVLCLMVFAPLVISEDTQVIDTGNGEITKGGDIGDIEGDPSDRDHPVNISQCKFTISNGVVDRNGIPFRLFILDPDYAYELTEGKDFIVEYRNPKGEIVKSCPTIGDYVASFRGIGYYTGLYNQTVKVTKVFNYGDLILNSVYYNYTGSAIKPDILVRHRGEIFKEGIDYTLEIEKDWDIVPEIKDIGKYTIKVRPTSIFGDVSPEDYNYERIEVVASESLKPVEIKGINPTNRIMEENEVLRGSTFKFFNGTPSVDGYNGDFEYEVRNLTEVDMYPVYDGDLPKRLGTYECTVRLPESAYPLVGSKTFTVSVIKMDCVFAAYDVYRFVGDERADLDYIVSPYTIVPDGIWAPSVERRVKGLLPIVECPTLNTQKAGRYSIKCYGGESIKLSYFNKAQHINGTYYVLDPNTFNAGFIEERLSELDSINVDNFESAMFLKTKAYRLQRFLERSAKDYSFITEDMITQAENIYKRGSDYFKYSEGDLNMFNPNPNQPSIPDTPDEPDTPDKPDEPDTPDIPDKPNTSTDDRYVAYNPGGSNSSGGSHSSGGSSSSNSNSSILNGSKRPTTGILNGARPSLKKPTISNSAQSTTSNPARKPASTPTVTPNVSTKIPSVPGITPNTPTVTPSATPNTSVEKRKSLANPNPVRITSQGQGVSIDRRNFSSNGFQYTVDGYSNFNISGDTLKSLQQTYGSALDTLNFNARSMSLKTSQLRGFKYDRFRLADYYCEASIDLGDGSYQGIQIPVTVKIPVEDTIDQLVDPDRKLIAVGFDPTTHTAVDEVSVSKSKTEYRFTAKTGLVYVFGLK